ncbi:MAG: hypothetical protein ACJ790_00910 [Myxococcaceae bacterium]
MPKVETARMGLGRKLLEMDAKRLFALAIGPGILALGVDAWISHFCGKDGEGLQWVPVIFAPIGMIIAVAWGAFRLNARAFRWGLTILGLLSVGVGLWGTALHMKAIWVDLSDETINWASIQGALGSGPPLFAPLAFAGVGALIALVAQPIVDIRLMLARKPVIPTVATAPSIVSGRNTAQTDTTAPPF